MKECCRCNENKDLAEFGLKVSAVDGLSSSCKICDKLYARQYRLNNRHAIQERELLKRYGMPLGGYAEMLSAQEGCCDICGIHEKHTQAQRLHVDHDHETGTIRSLLCHHCNTAIGSLKDSSEVTHKATLYLIKHGK